VFYDEEKKKRLVFITNNLELPALSVALLYKSRWQVELFFKWIKQHLRIKSFFGYTENALRCQIWIALSVYLLVAIIKRELEIERSIYEILQILSVTPFEKTPILSILEQTQVTKIDNDLAKPRFLWD
jgi:IS4 transposase